MTRRLVAVAMSGGVDSSVAAALLREQGEDAIGLMLRLRDPGDPKASANRCCSPDDMAVARRVAAQLRIPFYVLDARAVFEERVIRPFLDGYAKGLTPNPCLECNLYVRWGYLLKEALALGATHLATGHYARLSAQDGRWLLLRAVDGHKDQSYVLSVLGQDHLSLALFPIGDYHKLQVREHARRLGLPVAERPESQDLCFLGGEDYRQYLPRHQASLPPPGPIVDREGRVLGTHPGLFAYTIGQRKAIGVASPEPLYVLEKDASRNVLVVGPRSALGRRRFRLGRVNWVSGLEPEGPFRAQVRVRYKAIEVGARLVPLPGRAAEVELDQALPDVTPGQAAVFYDDQVCLGGGLILP